jgi:hypothetical protein
MKIHLHILNNSIHISHTTFHIQNNPYHKNNYYSHFYSIPYTKNNLFHPNNSHITHYIPNINLNHFQINHLYIKYTPALLSSNHYTPNINPPPHNSYINFHTIYSQLNYHFMNETLLNNYNSNPHSFYFILYILNKLNPHHNKHN